VIYGHRPAGAQHAAAKRTRGQKSASVSLASVDAATSWHATGGAMPQWIPGPCGRTDGYLARLTTSDQGGQMALRGPSRSARSWGHRYRRCGVIGHAQDRRLRRQRRCARASCAVVYAKPSVNCQAATRRGAWWSTRRLEVTRASDEGWEKQGQMTEHAGRIDQRCNEVKSYHCRACLRRYEGDGGMVDLGILRAPMRPMR
jgi:hypothetical protein